MIKYYISTFVILQLDQRSFSRRKTTVCWTLHSCYRACNRFLFK